MKSKLGFFSITSITSLFSSCYCYCYCFSIFIGIFFFNSLLLANPLTDTSNAVNQSNLKTDPKLDLTILKSGLNYEINSEFSLLRKTSKTQSDTQAGHKSDRLSDHQLDNKILLGRNWNWSWNNKHPLNTSIGVKNYHQNLNENNQTLTGPLVQLKQTLLPENLFVLFEYYELTGYDSYQPQESKKTYNKTGLIFFDYRNLTTLIYSDTFSSLIYSDIYAESFHMPAISKEQLLTAARFDIHLSLPSTFLPIKNAPASALSIFNEVYHKGAPDNWGGSYTDLRFGIQVQPFSFISAKAFTNIISTQQSSEYNNFGFQLNLFKQGEF